MNGTPLWGMTKLSSVKSVVIGEYQYDTYNWIWIVLGVHWRDATQSVFSQKKYLYVVSIFIISIFGNMVFVQWGVRMKHGDWSKNELKELDKILFVLNQGCE